MRQPLKKKRIIDRHCFAFTSIFSCETINDEMHVTIYYQLIGHVKVAQLSPTNNRSKKTFSWKMKQLRPMCTGANVFEKMYAPRKSVYNRDCDNTSCAPGSQLQTHLMEIKHSINFHFSKQPILHLVEKGTGGITKHFFAKVFLAGTFTLSLLQDFLLCTGAQFLVRCTTI